MKKLIILVALVSISAISFGQVEYKEVVFENNAFSMFLKPLLVSPTNTATQNNG